MVKAVILIGGPGKGTRFRPLSLEVPKPLFPLAGRAMIEPHIEACSKLNDMQEVFLIGNEPQADLVPFVRDVSARYNVKVTYLQEYKALGTAGGIYHFRDQIKKGHSENFFVLNADVCCDFPLQEMLNSHLSHADPYNNITIMGTKVEKEQSMQYGCLVAHASNVNEVQHYVEKPETFISNIINCGVYVLGVGVLDDMKNCYQELQQASPSTDCIELETDIIAQLVTVRRLFLYRHTGFWSQIKTAGSAVYASQYYLSSRKLKGCPDLATGPNIIGDVLIHPTAKVADSALLGPNVTIGANTVVKEGVRIKHAILLDDCEIEKHTCILYSVVGGGTKIGSWSRIEGTPTSINANNPNAHISNPPMFNEEGKLNPNITVLGHNTAIQSGKVILNSVILPYKELSYSYKNIILL